MTSEYIQPKSIRSGAKKYATMDNTKTRTKKKIVYTIYLITLRIQIEQGRDLFNKPVLLFPFVLLLPSGRHRYVTKR